MNNNLSHKIRLYPTNEQEHYLTQAVGITRFTYNWALDKAKSKLDNKQKLNLMSLKKEFNSIKHVEFPWMLDIHKDANQQPFANLKKAFTNYFKTKMTTKHFKFPTFKKRGKSNDSFYLSNDKFKIEGNKIRIPRLGWVEMAELPRFAGNKILSAVVSRKANNKWFVSISYHLLTSYYKKARISNEIVGIDLGLTTFATLSTGEKIVAPKPLKSSLDKLKRANQNLHRKVKGSTNRKKSQLKVAEVHYRIANIRNDFLHKLSTRLCRENQAIGIEDLNVSGMVKNRSLSRSISDASWGEFRRQLGYKSEIYDTSLYVVDRFFASSKICSDCGVKNTSKMFTLSVREWLCVNCNELHDRDINAAINIRNRVLKQLNK